MRTYLSPFLRIYQILGVRVTCFKFNDSYCILDCLSISVHHAWIWGRKNAGESRSLGPRWLGFVGEKHFLVQVTATAGMTRARPMGFVSCFTPLPSQPSRFFSPQGPGLALSPRDLFRFHPPRDHSLFQKQQQKPPSRIHESQPPPTRTCLS